MRRFYIIRVMLVLGIFAGANLVCYADKPLKEVGVEVKTILLLSAPLETKEGEAIPRDIKEIALPFRDQALCEGIYVIPNMALLRADLNPPRILQALLKEDVIHEQGAMEKIAEMFKKTPSYNVMMDKIKLAVDAVRTTRDWTQRSETKVDIDSIAADGVVRDATLRLIYTAGTKGINDSDINRAFKDQGGGEIVTNTNGLQRKILEKVCKEGVEKVKQLAEQTSVAVVYKPSVGSVGGEKEVISEPQNKGGNLCNQNLLLQGIQFVSLARLAAQNKSVRATNLNNAFQIFNNAVLEADSAGSCCARALMNRGITRDLLGEVDLAIQDLNAAERCDATSSEIYFNLACFHSKNHSKQNPQLGVALQNLEKAVKAGFRDCDILLKDPDLLKLRSDVDFKDKFRRMLQQNGLYCTSVL